jgi:hypothetical protein
MRRHIAWVGLGLLVMALPAALQADVAPLPEAEISAADDQFWRGFNLLHGRGVEPDAAQSTQWFQRAAEQGHLRSQVHLGMAYLKGRGVDVDRARAHEWLLKAADQGHPKAQLEVGILYMEGGGVSRDRVEGAKWLMLSVYAGGPMVRAKVPHYLKTVPRPQYRMAQARARAWRVERGLPVPDPKSPDASE